MLRKDSRRAAGDGAMDMCFASEDWITFFGISIYSSRKVSALKLLRLVSSRIDFVLCPHCGVTRVSFLMVTS